MRLACAPRKWIFFKAPLNLVRKKQTAIESHCQQKQHYHHCHHHDVSKVDLLAILPYFVSFVMEELKVTVEYDDHDHHLYIIGRFCLCVCNEKVTKFFLPPHPLFFKFFYQKFFIKNFFS